MKKLILLLLFISMPHTLFAAYGVRYTVVEGDAEKQYMRYIEEELPKLGFVLSDPHERINDGYAKKYGSTKLDNLGFFSISNDKVMRKLLLESPQLGGFSPFNLHIYKKRSENKTYIGHIDTSTMLNIVRVDNKKVAKSFKKMMKPLDASVKKQFGEGKFNVKYDNLPKYPMMKFTLNFTRGADLLDFIEDFQEKYENAFEGKDYIIAGYKNYKEAYTDLELPFEKYDAYFVYSLCHFGFSHSIFEDRTDAGVFAPCSMYMYIEKGSNTLHIGMPKLENWISVMGIKDAQKVNDIVALDKEIITIMQSLGANEVIPEKLTWISSYDEALAKAKKEHKPVLAFMNKKGCGACKFMKTKTFMNEKLIHYLNQNFVMLSLDIHKNNAPKALQVKMTPIFHFLKSDGTLAIDTLVGGKSADKLMPYLEKALKANH